MSGNFAVRDPRDAAHELPADVHRDRGGRNDRDGTCFDSQDRAHNSRAHDHRRNQNAYRDARSDTKGHYSKMHFCRSDRNRAHRDHAGGPRRTLSHNYGNYTISCRYGRHNGDCRTDCRNLYNWYKNICIFLIKSFVENMSLAKKKYF